MHDPSLIEKYLCSQVSSEPKAVPSDTECRKFQNMLNNSANMIFHAATGLPLQSSPVSVLQSSYIMLNIPR